uniref:DNA cross-link repair 1A protein n=1 Tax=Timema poppense TaxID=170557 RepID=A0A7R9CMM6_TIMPO|nr:unnamed protein product [Timema poppensis]
MLNRLPVGHLASKGREGEVLSTNHATEQQRLERRIPEAGLICAGSRIKIATLMDQSILQLSVSRRNRLSMSQSQEPSFKHFVAPKPKESFKEFRKPVDELLLTPPKPTPVTTSSRMSYSDSAGSSTPQYCPNCQVPFTNIKILPSIHAAQCDVSFDELTECPEGKNCRNTSVFHYRDFAHLDLAATRAMEETRIMTSRQSLSSQSTHLIGYSSDSPSLISKTEVADSSLGQEESQELSITDCVLSDVPDVGLNVKELSQNIVKDSTPNDDSVTASNIQLIDSLDSLDTLICENNNAIDKVVEKHTVPCGDECVKRDVMCLKTGEVRATLSLVMSPAKNKASLVGAIPSPVKLLVSCSDNGWKDVGMDTSEHLNFSDVKVSLCECSKSVEVRCVVSDCKVSSRLGAETACADPSDSHPHGSEETTPPLTRTYNSSQSPVLLSVVSSEPSSKYCNEVYSIISSSSTEDLSDKLDDWKERMKNVEFRGSVPIFACRESGKPFRKNPSLYTRLGMNHDIPVINSPFYQESDPLDHALTKEIVKFLPTAEKVSNGNEWKTLMGRMRSRGQQSAAKSAINDTTSTNQSNSYRPSRGMWSNSAKPCPLFKRIPDTLFVVDAFQYGIIPGVLAYFLTHFHSDHYGGLRKSFNQPIYCSSITAALVSLKLGVDKAYLNVIDVDETKTVCGVKVTALDANHCPGSLMFLFQLAQGRNFLHVGDFRADPKMESYPCFWNLAIDRLYLDTTYCDPKHSFPSQSDTIARVLEVTKSNLRAEPRTLVLCGSYTIGKEKVFLAVANLLNSKIWAAPDKRRVLRCLKDPIISQRLVDKAEEAQVHVCPMGDLNVQVLSNYLQKYSFCRKYTHILAFRPTGWVGGAPNIAPVRRNNITICGVPYSEHSSFLELGRFVRFLKPRVIIPTVNSRNNAAMQKYFVDWLTDRPEKRRSVEDSTCVQSKLTRYFSK